MHRVPQSSEGSAKVKPETIQKPDQVKAVPARKDPLLAEDIKSNKEQRKADWAIMKEMATYLWPKVESFSFSWGGGLTLYRIV